MYLFSFPVNLLPDAMIPTADNLLDILAAIAPPSLAEEWDNVGLLVGCKNQPVHRILVALDVTTAVIDEAVSIQADTIVSHHPLIFKPLVAINTDTPEGRLLQKALCHNIAIIACHTNLDAASDGVNTALARNLELTNTRPLVPSTENQQMGLGRIGTFSPAISWATLQQRLFEALSLQHLMIAGTPPETIKTMALLGGSGSGYARIARAQGAEIYLTSEVKHDTAIWARDVGFCIIDGTHFATERPGAEHLCTLLRQTAQQNDWQTVISMTTRERHPFTVISNIS